MAENRLDKLHTHCYISQPQLNIALIQSVARVPNAVLSVKGSKGTIHMQHKSTVTMDPKLAASPGPAAHQSITHMVTRISLRRGMKHEFRGCISITLRP